MKIILTGGTGLIGRELGKDLVREGHEIVLLTRNPEDSKTRVPYPHTSHFWDGEKSVLEANIYEGVDGIIHLAGVGIADKRWNQSFKKKLEDSRVLATQNLLKNAPKDLKFMIGSSAIGYYKASDQPMHEEQLPASHFFGELCENWEAAAYKCLDKSRTRIVHIRTGVVLSPHGGALEQMVEPLKTGLAGPLAGGDQIMSWIDIQDIVGIYLYALNNSSMSGPYNGVAPNPVTNKELTKIIGQRVSRPVFMPVPGFAIKLVVGEAAKYILMSQNVSSKKIEKAGYKFKYSTVKESLEKNIPKLGFSEKRFYQELYIEEPIEKVFEFFSSEKNLERITPPSLQFKVLSKSTDEIEEGTLINYRLKLDGIVPLNWQTLITKWNPPHEFQDFQKKGPYRKWAHTHKFEKLGKGVLMSDQVDHDLPMGTLGWAVAGWKIKRDVNKIFDYRTKVLKEVF